MTVVAQGVDYSFDHPTPAELCKAGKKFVHRYMFPLSQVPGTKNLTKVEADALKAHGIEIASNYESFSGRAKDGFEAGQTDARAADRQHRACGGPADRPIFMSVDFDTTPADFPHIDAYFKGVASVLGKQRVGAYGEYDLVRHLMDNDLVGKSDSAGHYYTWQTYAWSAGKFDERCCTAQDKNGVRLGSGTVDLDSAHCVDYGQWGYKSKTPTPPPPPKPTAVMTLTAADLHAIAVEVKGAVVGDETLASSARETHDNVIAIAGQLSTLKEMVAHLSVLVSKLVPKP